jgi:type IV pilus assembly protein PilM
MPGLVAPMNAFEVAMSKEFAGDVFALVDIGFKHTTICLFRQGELVMSREVAIGGDRFTTGLSENMNISYAEAESIKIGMPTEVQNHLEPMVIPLGRELRASVDFFEHQQDRALSGIYFSGGSSRSEFILQILKQELLMDCRIWNPTAGLQQALPAQKASELEHVAPQLSVAIGAALTAL